MLMKHDLSQESGPLLNKLVTEHRHDATPSLELDTSATLAIVVSGTIRLLRTFGTLRLRRLGPFRPRPRQYPSGPDIPTIYEIPLPQREDIHFPGKPNHPCWAQVGLPHHSPHRPGFHNPPAPPPGHTTWETSFTRGKVLQQCKFHAAWELTNGLGLPDTDLLYSVFHILCALKSGITKRCHVHSEINNKIYKGNMQVGAAEINSESEAAQLRDLISYAVMGLASAAINIFYQLNILTFVLEYNINVRTVGVWRYRCYVPVVSIELNITLYRNMLYLIVLTSERYARSPSYSLVSVEPRGKLDIIVIRQLSMELSPSYSLVSVEPRGKLDIIVIRQLSMELSPSYSLVSVEPRGKLDIIVICWFFVELSGKLDIIVIRQLLVELSRRTPVVHGRGLAFSVSFINVNRMYDNENQRSSIHETSPYHNSTVFARCPSQYLRAALAIEHMKGEADHPSAICSG
ncbi:hypothetical protein J6590_073885 [Homalodisca vitripennis]|nr:hypothetical protein J6590_073885 [Homalodisca vitripennis]